jgi:MraZ protein
MSIFLSTYINKLDKKGRVSVPASFRASLEKQPTPGIVALRSYASSAIEVFGGDIMERMVKQVDDMAMFSAQRSDFAAALFADCEHLSFDSEGRITLTENLLKHANIQDRVAFVGCGSTFQMWEPDTFAHQKDLARSRLQQGGITLPSRSIVGGQ